MQAKHVPLLIILFLLPLAFDYRNADENGSHALQYALVAPVLFSGFLLSLKGPRFRARSQLRSIVTSAMTLTICGSFVTQIVQGNDIGQYLRVMLSFVLFVLGYFVGCHPWSEGRLRTINQWLLLSLALSTFASFLTGIMGGGGIDEVRYRIVSPVLLGFQGLLLYELVVRRQRSVVNLMFLLGTLSIELLSVTRSLLVATILLFCFAAWLSAPTAKKLVVSLMRTAVIAGAILGVTYSGAALIYPSLLNHWSQRIFYAETDGGGKDPTTLSRLAEMQEQYDQVTADATSLLLGKGFGHEYHYAEEYIVQLLHFSSRNDLEASGGWAAGHNFWVYQFFAGGIAFGLALPVALLYSLYRCGTAYRRFRGVAANSHYLNDTGKFAMVLAGMVGTTVGGNPLGPRFGGLIYGVAFGLLIAAHSRLRESRRNGENSPKFARSFLHVSRSVNLGRLNNRGMMNRSDRNP